MNAPIMKTRLFLNEQAKAMFRVMSDRFNKTRATREVSKQFGVSASEVKRASYYW